MARFLTATLSDEDTARFWSKTDKTPGHGPWGDCWLWTGAVDGEGYGSFSIGYRTFRAHRVAFFLVHGHWPRDCCLHTCDIPLCMRHTYEGSLAQNTADMMTRGRNLPPRGERQGNSKLTTQQVREIRASSEKQAILAARYGICRSQISMIRGRKRWAHV